MFYSRKLLNSATLFCVVQIKTDLSDFHKMAVNLMKTKMEKN